MNRALCIAASIAIFVPTTAPAATLTGEIRDEASGSLIAARVYLRDSKGQWFFPKSADPAGKAVEYRKERGPTSAEMHTALSAHPFTIELPAGKYTLTVEKGKEYLPHEEEITIADRHVRTDVRLRRLVNMADLGWYSGDTHVHRTMAELPTAMLADDLNVAFPLTYWVTKSDTPPSQGDKNQPAVEPKVIEVAPRHIIWPLNTEYEIFTVGPKRHTLGAVFGLGHKTVLARGVPPVRPIAEQVHREGGLLDIDKHNWPWSMMLVPVMKPDLFELANNHHWRTQFAFRTFGEPIPAYMNLPTGPDGFDEKAWTEFGFQNYYALLNCGFRMMPTAGTASGVHPVPLGWGRVYVRCRDGFSLESWMRSLAEGRSFVTTGPLMQVTVNGEPALPVYRQAVETARYEFGVNVWSHFRPTRWEVLKDGKVVSGGSSRVAEKEGGQEPGSRLYLSPRTSGLAGIRVSSSTWIAVRCFETLPDGRERFAHSAPIFIDVPGKPLLPKKAEAEYLVSRVKAEIERNTGVLSEEALAEFREALAAYEAIAAKAE